MGAFLVVLFLSVLGFAFTFYIIAWNNKSTENMFTGNNIFAAAAYSWYTMVGAFNTDGFEYWDWILLYFIWFGHTLFTMFILLNLLIGIMGDSFGKVQETAENNMWRERAGLMVENEKFMSRVRQFRGAKYIIVVEKEQAEESYDSWEGQLKQMSKYMDKQIDS